MEFTFLSVKECFLKPFINGRKNKGRQPCCGWVGPFGKKTEIKKFRATVPLAPNIYSVPLPPSYSVLIQGPAILTAQMQSAFGVFSCSPGTAAPRPQQLSWHSCFPGTAGLQPKLLSWHSCSPGTAAPQPQLLPWHSCSLGTAAPTGQFVDHSCPQKVLKWPQKLQWDTEAIAARCLTKVLFHWILKKKKNCLHKYVLKFYWEIRYQKGHVNVGFYAFWSISLLSIVHKWASPFSLLFLHQEMDKWQNSVCTMRTGKRIKDRLGFHFPFVTALYVYVYVYYKYVYVYI